MNRWISLAVRVPTVEPIPVTNTGIVEFYNEPLVIRNLNTPVSLSLPLVSPGGALLQADLESLNPTEVGLIKLLPNISGRALPLLL